MTKRGSVEKPIIGKQRFPECSYDHVIDYCCDFAIFAPDSMNPITNIKNQNKLNESELKLGISGDLGKSWHQKYKDSAWIYIGGLPYELTEGDIITVFSQ
ncbi:hypothetical protein ANCDUO_00609 [Ancylostoma duodenale]|uniref:RRM domain-containing protein n=1 Tax=Ancylostoma duodenale TaxID=51022 RepID=A0A0C2HHD4_9BILA|nr:hypothetical protein ANCDUO_00609 [Ancylostoma duodenale]